MFVVLFHFQLCLKEKNVGLEVLVRNCWKANVPYFAMLPQKSRIEIWNALRVVKK